MCVRYEDALECAGGWLVRTSNDASTHYVRGRALLKLGRYGARDAFDGIAVLKPEMLEAMLLRHELIELRDGCASRWGAAAIEIDLPSISKASRLR